MWGKAGHTGDMNIPPSPPQACFIYARLPPIDDSTSTNLLLPNAQCDDGSHPSQGEIPTTVLENLPFPPSWRVPRPPQTSAHPDIQLYLITLKKNPAREGGRHPFLYLICIDQAAGTLELSAPAFASPPEKKTKQISE